MNARKRRSDNEILPSTPDTESSWLKIRTDSRRARISPDPPPSPSPRPRPAKQSQETSLGPTQQAGIVQVKDNFAVAGIVHDSDSVLAHHVDSNDAIQPTAASIDAGRNDPSIYLGDAKHRDGPISSTKDEASTIYPLNGLLPLHSLPFPQIQQILNDSVKNPSDMSMRTRESSPIRIWPQTAQDAFEKARPAYEAYPGAQHTFDNQTLFNAGTQREIKTEVPRGPAVPPTNRMQGSEGSVLEPPFDTLRRTTHITRRTLQPRTSTANPNNNIIGPPLRMQNHLPQQVPVPMSMSTQTPNLAPKQSTFPNQTRNNSSMHIPQHTFSTLPAPPVPNTLTGPHSHPLSANPTLNLTLQPGDRVYLLDSSHNDPGNTIWKITSISPLGVVTITPIATPRQCPSTETKRLLRAPLVVGDIVSVYHQEIQTGVTGNQVFCSVKRGFGRVVRCYVVGGVRRYDVLREDEVGRGIVERGLGDGDVGHHEMRDQVEVIGGVGC